MPHRNRAWLSLNRCAWPDLSLIHAIAIKSELVYVEAVEDVAGDCRTRELGHLDDFVVV